MFKCNGPGVHRALFRNGNVYKGTKAVRGNWAKVAEGLAPL